MLWPPCPAMEPSRAVALRPHMPSAPGRAHRATSSWHVTLVDMLRDDLEANKFGRSTPLLLPRSGARGSSPTWFPLLDPLLLPAGRYSPHGVGSSLCPNRESLLSTDVQGSSAIPTARERGWDLGYRGVLPKSLGATLCSLSTHELDALAQSCASLRPAELQQFSKRRTALPAIRVVRCLLLGLNCREALPTPLPEEAAVQAGALPRDALQAWFTTGSGLRSVQELRWALLAPPLSADSFLAKLFEHGGAVLQDSAPYWPNGPYMASCHFEPLLSLQVPARRCWTCGGAVLPVHSPCRWRHNHSQLHCASCNPLLRAMLLESRCPCSVRLPRRRCHSVLLRCLAACLPHSSNRTFSCSCALVQPGAGSAASLPPKHLRLKHVRRPHPPSQRCIRAISPSPAPPGRQGLVCRRASPTGRGLPENKMMCFRSCSFWLFFSWPPAKCPVPAFWDSLLWGKKPSSGPDPTSRAENPVLGLFSSKAPNCRTLCPPGSTLPNNLVNTPFGTLSGGADIKLQIGSFMHMVELLTTKLDRIQPGRFGTDSMVSAPPGLSAVTSQTLRV